MDNCPCCGLFLAVIDDMQSYYACHNCGCKVDLPKDMMWIAELKQAGAKCECKQGSFYFEHRQVESSKVQRLIYACRTCGVLLAVKEFVKLDLTREN